MLLMGLTFLHGLAIGTSLAVLVAVLAADHAAAGAARLRRVRPSTDSASAARKQRDRRGDVAPVGRFVAAPARRRSPSPARRALRRSPCRCSRCGSASPTRATTRRRAPRTRPTTSSPRASVRAPTARSWSSPSRPSPGAAAACPGSLDAVARNARRCVRQRRHAEPVGHCGAGARCPDDRAAGRGHRQQLVHHLRDDVVPGATAGTGLGRAPRRSDARASIDFADVIGRRASDLHRRGPVAQLPAAAASCSARCSCR